MRFRDFYNLFSVAVVLLVAALFFGPGALRKKITNAPESEPTPVAVVTTGTVGSGTLGEVAPEPTPKWFLPKEINQLARCKKKPMNKEMWLPPSSFQGLFSKKQKVVMISSGNVCFEKGQDIEIIETMAETKSGFAFGFRRTLKGKIGRIAEFNPRRFNRLDFTAWKLPEQMVQKIAIRASRKGKAPRVAIIEFDGIEFDLSKPRLAKPLRHPRGKTYTAKEALELVKGQGALLVDVRSKAAFDRGHHPLAVHYPFFLPMKVEKTPPLDPKGLLRIGFEVTGNFRKYERDKLIIFYGRHRFDVDPYNAVSIFSYRGFKNVGWIPGGIGELSGFDMEPSPNGWTGILRAEEIPPLLERGAVLIDVRSEVEYGYKMTAKAAREEPYLFPPFMERFKLMKASVTAEELKNAKEFWSGNVATLKPDQKVILMGLDYLDWRPLFTRRLIGDAVREIYWYRGGVVDWMDQSAVNPQRYPARPVSPGFGSVMKRIKENSLDTLAAAEIAEFESLRAERKQAQIDIARDISAKRLERKQLKKKQ